MYIKSFFFSLLIVLSATFLYAADDGNIPRQMDKSLITTPGQTEPQIAKRELKFEVSEDEQPLTLEKVQEGMLDQHYVATFKLVLTKKEKSDDDTRRGDLLGRNMMRRSTNVTGFANNQILGILRSDTFHNIMTTSDWVRLNDFEIYQSMLIWRLSESNLNGFFRYPQGFYILSKMAPEDHQISFLDGRFISPLRDRRRNEKKDELPLFTPFFVEITSQSDESEPFTFIELKLLAPTPEKAESWVRDWFTVYDWGLCYSAEKECLDIKQKLQQMLAESRDKLKNSEALLQKAKDEADKYKEFDDIKPETLVTFTTQRRMLAVDLAGIKARIKACEEMLAKEAMSTNRKDQVETTKVSAEIELRGLDAKKAEIDRIIEGAQNRQTILKNTQNLPDKISYQKSIIDLSQKAIREIEDYQLGYQPLPVQDAKVTIRKIKWVSPPKTDNQQPEDMQPSRRDRR